MAVNLENIASAWVIIKVGPYIGRCVIKLSFF